MWPVKASSRAERMLVLPVPFGPCSRTTGASNGRSRVPSIQRKSETIKRRIGMSLIVVLDLFSPTRSLVRVSAEGLSYCARAIGRRLDKRDMVRSCLQWAERRHHLVGRIAPVDQVR